MDKPTLYVTSNNVQRSDARDFSEEFANEIGKMSGRCLDVGSGPGDTVVDLILPKLEEKATLICSDISEIMVNFGKEKYKDNRRLSYIKLDIESRQLSKNLIQHFDHVTSFYCLNWCQHMHNVFDNIFNLLRPNGTAFLVFVANSPLCEAYPVLAAIPQYQPYMEDVDRYIPVFQHVKHKCETLKSLIRAVGFEVHHCSLRDRRHIFRTPEALDNFLLALDPFTKRMPSSLEKEYKKDLSRECKRQILKSNKNYEEEKVNSVNWTHNAFVLFLKKPATM